MAVNHLEGHLYASLLEDPGLQLPVVVLLVSGGHTLLIRMDAPGDYRLLGRTEGRCRRRGVRQGGSLPRARLPGGPAIDRVAASGDAGAAQFPRAWLDGSVDFSFSGLKTAVVNQVTAEPALTTADVAASFQEAVVDVLVHKTLAAAAEAGAGGICLAGGVAANSSCVSAFGRPAPLPACPYFCPAGRCAPTMPL